MPAPLNYKRVIVLKLTKYIFPGMGHYELLDPEHESFQLVLRHLREHLDN